MNSLTDWALFLLGVLNGWASLLLLVFSVLSFMSRPSLDGARAARPSVSFLVAGTGVLLFMGYGLTFAATQITDDPIERFVFRSRAFGPYAWTYWSPVAGSLLSQTLWLRWVRQRRLLTTIAAAIIVAIQVVNVGVTFLIVRISSLERSELPSSWP